MNVNSSPHAGNPSGQTAQFLYLDLMKRSLLNMIYGDKEVVYAAPRHPLKQMIVKAVRKSGLEPVHRRQFDAAKRLEGRDWPTDGQSMLSIARLDNVQMCVEQALRDGIGGDLIETGVWRGGAAILMRAILKAHDVRDRVVYVADSFAGLPPPDKDYPQDADIPYHTFTELAISLEEVKGNFERYGLLDDQVRFLQRLVQGHAADRAACTNRCDAVGWGHVRVHNGRPESAVSQT